MLSADDDCTGLPRTGGELESTPIGGTPRPGLGLGFNGACDESRESEAL